MSYSALVILVKNECENHPKKLMDEICKYHLSEIADKKRISGEIIDDRVKYIKKLPEEIKDFLNSDRKLLYFGIGGKELDKILEVKNDT